MKVQKSKALIAGAAAIALALTACSSSGGKPSGSTGSKSSGGGGGSSSSSSSSKPGTGTMVYGESTAFPENLQPLIAAGNSTSTGYLESRLFNGLYRFTPQITFQLDPDQADGTPTSAMVNGQQVVTFKLNPKAVWDDGQPITAADWVFTWQDEKSTDPKTGGCAALLGSTGWDQIQTVDAVDDHTVKMTFQKGKPYGDWKLLLAGAPLAKHVYDKGSPAANCAYITKGWATKSGFPAGVTNGPWILSNVGSTAKTFTLSANPKYWGAKPKLAHLIDTYIGSESDTNVKALQNQEVNMIYPQPQLDLVANLGKLTSVTTEINFGSSFEHVDLNTRDPLLKHLEIRQAFAYAVDRPALVNATVGKFSDKASVLGNRLVLSNQQGYEDHSGDYAKQNIAKAKSLLESIGCKMQSNGYYALNGKQLTFAIMTTQDNPLRDQTIATIANEVKAAGIKITENASPDIFTDKPDSLIGGGYQMALFAWVGGPAFSSNKSIYYTPSKGGGQNWVGISNPQIDAALDKMATSTDTTATVAAANAADKLLWAQMATLPLYQKPTLLAFDSNYTGVGDNSTQAGPLWNSETFAVKQ